MELREVQKYRPIPWEGVRLLAWVALAALVALGGAFFLGMIFPEASLSLAFWKGWVILCAIVLTALFRLGAQRINGYWERNVRGYEACFWIDKDEGVDPDVGIWVEEMRRPPDWAPCELNGRGKIFLRVPLGGWFRKRGQLFRVVNETNKLYRAPFRAWRIIVRQPITDPLIGSYIEVIDGKGDRIPLTVSETLRFAAWLSAGGIQEWRHEVPYLLRAVRESRTELNETRDERDEAKKRVETLEGELGAAVAGREDAIAAIDNAIIAIDATKRFQHHPSKEAKRIREGMIQDLLRLAPVGHPRRERYEKFDGQRQAS